MYIVIYKDINNKANSIVSYDQYFPQINCTKAHKLPNVNVTILNIKILYQLIAKILLLDFLKSINIMEIYKRSGWFL